MSLGWKKKKSTVALETRLEVSQRTGKRTDLWPNSTPEGIYSGHTSEAFTHPRLLLGNWTNLGFHQQMNDWEKCGTFPQWYISHQYRKMKFAESRCKWKKNYA